MNLEKLNKVVQEADYIFWEHIASQYPEALGGDLSPERTFGLNIAEYEAVKEWVKYNVEDN